jgi:hypothetical protein
MSKTEEKVGVNVDAAPKKQKQKKEKKIITLADIEEPVMNWIMYFYPSTVTIIMHRKMLIFSLVASVYYMVQFLACCASVNFYSDASRLAACNDLVDTSKPPVVGEMASAIMDPAIILLGVYHIIEWIRCTILLTVICLGVNMMQVWYALAINSVFGLICFIYCHVVYFGAAAKGCAENQPTRYQWLLAEIIIFWVTFFVFMMPPIIIRLFPKSNVHITLYRPDEEDEDSESDAE